MNKALKFPSHYIENILSQDKGITMRLFDEKNIVEGDIIDFINDENNAKFATVKIIKVEIMEFKDAMADAKNIEGMYEQYKAYYQRDIKPETPAKFLYFEFIKKYIE